MFHHAFSTLVILEVLTYDVTAGIFYFLPLWSHYTVYFSVTVQPEFRDSPEASVFSTAITWRCSSIL